MIQASQLTRSYRLGQSCIDAVLGISLAVQQGEKIAIIGRSGSGKSTLLNLLAGLDRPTSGTLTVHDKRLDQLSRTQMAEYRLKTIGVIFQAFQLIPQRTAFQNVELLLILGGVSPTDRQSGFSYRRGGDAAIDDTVPRIRDNIYDCHTRCRLNLRAICFNSACGPRC